MVKKKYKAFFLAALCVAFYHFFLRHVDNVGSALVVDSPGGNDSDRQISSVV